MTEETFWELIDALDGVIDDDGIDLLAERLPSLGPGDVEGFCAGMKRTGAPPGRACRAPI